MSSLVQQPRHWHRPVFKPLNTRQSEGTAVSTLVSDSLPLMELQGSGPVEGQPTRTQGASYVVLFPNAQAMGRRVTANQNSAGHAMFACPWVDAARFETDVLGFSNYNRGAKYLSRRIPLRHGDPAQQSLFLDSLETISFHNFDKEFHEACVPADGRYSAGWPKTEMIAYKGTFSQRSYEVLSDADVQSAAVPELKRYVTKFPETESYHRKIPGFGFAFASDPSNYCTVLASLPEFTQRWVYTSYFWPWPDSIDLGYIARTLGKVNAATFDADLQITTASGGSTAGFPAEHLKFEDHRLSQPYYGSDDKLYVDQQFVFSFQPNNWNKQVNPTTGLYEYIYQLGYTFVGLSVIPGFADGNRKAYTSADFNKLFWPKGAA